MHMEKGKVRTKLWQFIDLMKKGKGKLRDGLGKLMGLVQKGKDKLSDETRKLIGMIIAEACVLGLVYWIIARFFSATEDIYNDIVIIFIFAVGITIMLRGNTTRNLNSNTIGFLVFLVGVFMVIYRYEEFAIKISAFATVVVAVAAFAAVQENRRIRRESVEQGNRDRQERWIDEVAVWLRELGGRTLSKSGEFFFEEADMLIKMPKIDRETLLRARAADLAKAEWDALDGGIREAEYYQKLALQLNEELSSLIKVVVFELIARQQLHANAAKNKVDYVETLKASKLLKELIINDDKPLGGLDLSAKDIIVVDFGRNAGAIRKSIQKAIEKAIELKASLINVG